MKNNWMEIGKNLVLLTQLGLSLISPLLLCIYAAWWLTSHAGLGGWVFIPAFFFGLGGGIMVAYRFYLSQKKKAEKESEKKKRGLSFNSHF